MKNFDAIANGFIRYSLCLMFSKLKRIVRKDESQQKPRYVKIRKQERTSRIKSVNRIKEALYSVRCSPKKKEIFV